MNKNLYRIVFNQRRGQLMAVAETASSCSKSPSGTSKASRRSSNCSKTTRTPKNDQFHLSKVLPAQWIRAQAAPNLIAFASHADNQINLAAAKNESSLNSTNSSSSGSVSVSWGAGGWGGGASAARGKGKSDGEDTSFTNTNISAGNTAPILDLRTPLSLTDDDCVLIGKFVATASLISGAAN